LLNPEQEIKRETEEISSLNINSKLTQNQQAIANSFNGYFLTTAEKLMGANQIVSHE
jgi:cell division protein FtsI/penicillin-binding protein 2